MSKNNISFDEFTAWGLERNPEFIATLQIKSTKLFLEKFCNYREISSKDYIYDTTKLPEVITPHSLHHWEGDRDE
jgi:hypothetical protein